MSGDHRAYARSNGRAGPIRVMLSAEEPLFCDALGRSLRQEPALELIDDTSDRTDLVTAVRGLRPDVALVDGALLRDGIANVARLTRLLVLAAEIDGVDAYAAIEAGVAGYLSKDRDGEVMRRAAVRVARGETVLDQAVQTAIATEVRLRVRDERPALSPRERAILALVAEGRSTPDIGRQLHVSRATVKTHILHVYAKLGVEERAAAVASAMRQGLLE